MSGLPLLLLAAAAATAPAADERLLVLSEGKADRYWTLQDDFPAPAYPPGVTPDTGDVCVAIGYRLDADGVPFDFVGLKRWSAPAKGTQDPHRLDIFEQTAVSTLQRRKFVPAAGTAAHRVVTATTFAFAASPGSDTARLRKHCEIPNLQRFIYQAQRDTDRATWETIRWNGEWFHAKTRVHGLNRE